ncbi:MAG: hypothetical protein P8Z37_05980 [Acidobacteriota bacterium]
MGFVPSGINARKQYHRPEERPFTSEERDKVTILVGGLTRKHEEFIRAVFQGSGYKCELLPIPDQEAFHLGKEYGNNGQCSPAYFTSGALIQYLRDLEAGGMTRSEIVDSYLFFTAGSCGPCRFGMYAAEYRQALQNAGFDGFRVLRFQQDEGVRQKTQAPGLKYTIDFGLGMLKVLFLGDALNDLTHNIRPYEVHAGETDRVMKQCVEDICDHLRTYKAPDLADVSPKWVTSYLKNRNFQRGLAIGTWIEYLLAHAKMQTYPRRGLDSQYTEPSKWDLRQRLRNELSFQKKRALMITGEKLYAGLYHKVIRMLGNRAHRLVSQKKLADMADPYYKALARGGEGYLEVGKNIYYHSNNLCHMVLSLKPFGCLPSSQSDGVQSAVINRFKDMTYLPIETSGEGEINAHSRVQMALGEAKAKAKMEFQEILAKTGRSIEDIRTFVSSHPELRRSLYPVPHHDGVAGVAANFVLHVNDLMSGRAAVRN